MIARVVRGMRSLKHVVVLAFVFAGCHELFMHELVALGPSLHGDWSIGDDEELVVGLVRESACDTHVCRELREPATGMSRAMVLLFIAWACVTLLGTALLAAARVLAYCGYIAIDVGFACMALVVFVALVLAGCGGDGARPTPALWRITLAPLALVWSGLGARRERLPRVTVWE